MQVLKMSLQNQAGIFLSSITATYIIKCKIKAFTIESTLIFQKY